VRRANEYHPTPIRTREPPHHHRSRHPSEASMMSQATTMMRPMLQRQASVQSHYVVDNDNVFLPPSGDHTHLHHYNHMQPLVGDPAQLMQPAMYEGATLPRDYTEASTLQKTSTIRPTSAISRHPSGVSRHDYEVVTSPPQQQQFTPFSGSSRKMSVGEDRRPISGGNGTLTRPGSTGGTLPRPRTGSGTLRRQRQGSSSDSGTGESPRNSNMLGDDLEPAKLQELPPAADHHHYPQQPQPSTLPNKRPISMNLPQHRPPPASRRPRLNSEPSVAIHPPGTSPLQVVQIPQQKRTPLTIATTRLRIPSGNPKQRLSTQPSTPPIMEEGAFHFPEPQKGIPQHQRNSPYKPDTNSNGAVIYGTLPKHHPLGMAPPKQRLQPRKLDLVSVNQHPMMSAVPHHPRGTPHHVMQRYYGNQPAPNMYSSLRTRGPHANKMVYYQPVAPAVAMVPRNTYTPVPPSNGNHGNQHPLKFTSLPRSHRIVSDAPSGGGAPTEMDEGGFERPSTLNRKRHVPAAMMRQYSVPVTSSLMTSSPPLYVPKSSSSPGKQQPIYVPPPQVPTTTLGEVAAMTEETT